MLTDGLSAQYNSDFEKSPRPEKVAAEHNAAIHHTTKANAMTHLMTRLATLALVATALLGSTAYAHKGHSHADTGHKAVAEMTQAATAFLDTLDAKLRDQATFAFDGKERTDWHFIPKDRIGVSLKEMNLEQRKAAHTLLRTPLSANGYLKATAIMSLEQVLHELEKNSPTRKHDRDQERYWFCIFGEPGGKKPWGWRIEGHHLSLNFTSVGGKLVVSTPAFFGANPAEVRIGPRAGLRVLAAEEDLARKIMASLSEEQHKKADLAVEAPRDVITGPGQSIDIGEPVGLAASEMNKEQQKLLWQLIEQYAGSLRPEIAQGEWKEIKQNHEAIHFAWAGTLKRGEGHYYRIHAPAFIIEYDNTQNDANHIHTVWHSLSNDFGVDTLRRHYEETKHKE